MVSSLKPVERPAGLADRVYQTLREFLGSHRIRPGEPLQEAAIALQLGVSRTPVREALARLHSEGLIASEGRSFVVPELADEDVEEIYELRDLLEPAALARLAQTRPDAAALAPLVQALEDAAAADRSSNADAFIEANSRFHATWQEMVPNRRIVRALDLYVGHVRYLRVLTLGSPGARRAALAGMRNIVAALRKGDPERAGRAMHEHLQVVKQHLRDAPGELAHEAAE
jgi:DNA-binding GntR family transcriptional regulator